MLISLTDSLIVPGYEAASNATGDLRDALDSLCVRSIRFCAERCSAGVAGRTGPVDAFGSDMDSVR